MKVKDVMTREVRTCTRDTNLAQVAETMWTNDIGVIPVVDESRRIVGVITDRDVCIAMGTRHLLASQITTESVMSGLLFVSQPDDDVKSALETMRAQRVRRVPVINADGVVEGLLSIDDLAVAAHKNGGVTLEDVALTLKAISRHELPASLEGRRATVAAAGR